MRTLVIETATGACSVALIEHGAVIAHAHEEVGRGHAERLIPMIAALPDKGRAGEILVDCGPGSFTGVRVGLAAARALGLAWGAVVHGYSSLALIAAAADWNDVDSLAVAIDGGHGQLFVQRFAKEPMKPLSDLASLVPEEAARFVPDDRIVGNAAATLVAARGSGHAASVGLEAARVVVLPVELRALAAVPIYGRAPDAKPMA
ncbi:tRNA (adenosine(37)-N6)-threonylcarbamoyltransferase complex dimerization subunit type 1 TsaB [Sphingomonas colocasiae]|uniref:tRNA (Adenosine(37)-N6)-threonylcarbamoyltransferase complex dimerization subunit type 1 TsaB n=1 Tax=Sphingomonas colocasiae TaxID=1848973 RepID=A0ABS7PS14_9SPHN|nr:tRNA (adenosine(37)-N6)-threonylcarbamoyltransferase complex dimerization subunit type 1 TsaB [Sphingomonas colocasiae]MBY8824083.1 tRNA (adenosine(37)-N6)-threonylcarbamoyltransferase complex dimerization subunit type 1 TsaB [Sphingomonas colocasiae]